MSPVFVALDTPDLTEATRLAQAVAPYVGGLKAGLEFYSANGPAGIQSLLEVRLPLFLDLKLHDIPNTVASTVRALGQLGVDFLTIHASGGPAMLRAAVAAAREAPKKLRLLGVTVLTSLDDGDLSRVGQSGPVTLQVTRLAALAIECGLDGIVCAPSDILDVRGVLGGAPVLMVPGIRPEGAASDDQKRTMKPAAAMAAGATYLVVGRPITKADDPVRAAWVINETLGEAA